MFRLTAISAVVAFLGALAAAAVAHAAEPRLPAGLAPVREEPSLPTGLVPKRAEPSLPAGLGAPSPAPKSPAGLKDADAPSLPPGLSGQPAKRERPEETPPIFAPDLNGFWEARGGSRLRDDEHERDASIAETRLQLETDRDVAGMSLHVAADLVLDGLADRRAVDLETGDGFIDLRESNLVFSLATNLDVKAGRQILTWGTGDLVFINDMFPKDWNSFFLGRDEAYLKAPSDAVKFSAFGAWANLDLVYTPQFDADRFIDGRRVSFFDSTRGRIVGRNAVVRTDRPASWFKDDEWAARLHRTVAGYELALYGYDGFWKSPAGSDPATGRSIFPRLSVYGASVRGPLGTGIVNAETGYYDSREDRGGGDPNLRNSEFRLLIGYEQEIAKNLTFGGQYYLEHMRDHGAYRRTLPAGAPAKDENRHLLTGRLTWLTKRQTVEYSLFVFYSPSDRDAYLRPRVTYDATDRWTVEAGGNLFFGANDNTFFGQFQKNDNAYVALRYGF